MKLSIILPVASFASYALGNVIVGRQAATILNDISTIATKLATVKSDVDNYSAGSSSTQQILKIQNDSSDLDKSLQAAGNDAKNSPALSDSDSTSIANAVVGLQPSIYSTLTSLINKKNDFRTALSGSSAISIVLTDIKNLRRDTNYFGANVTSKLSTTYSRIAPLLTGDIDYHFQRAQDAFSTP